MRIVTKRLRPAVLALVVIFGLLAAPAGRLAAGLQPEWKAQWIGTGPAVEPRSAAGFFKRTNELPNVRANVAALDGRSSLLRKTFFVRGTPTRAIAHVTGLGYYELFCNGRRVGDKVLAPAKSNYAKWVYYNSYDVTSQLQSGTNAIGLMLGNGWFNPYPKWWDPYRMQWFGSKRALLQVDIVYEDGSVQQVTSDDTWTTAPGPVLASCVYDGELYDAREEFPGWDRAGFDDSAWKRATVVQPPGGVLLPESMPGIRVTERLQPVSVSEPKPGVFVFNLGQNFAGWARLTVSGPRGTRVTLRYAEELLSDGSIDPTSNERATCTDAYILSGRGVEVYEPRFTYHGFQYVEVTGFPGVPTLTNLLGCVVHTDCEPTGAFECDNDLINRIHRATIWSQRSNLGGYPLDCPQRDERLGWFGDALVSMEEAMFNFDMRSFYRTWLEGIRRNQNEVNGDISIISPRPYVTDEPDPTWSSAFIVMNWLYYVFYADREFLAGQFPAMRRYVDFLGTQAKDHILPKYWIGDWGTIVPGWTEGEPVLVTTAFYYYNSLLVAKSARVLGYHTEARNYERLANEIRTAFNKRFYSPVSKRYEKGTQFSNAFPLYLGLVDEGDRAAVLNNILEDLRKNGGRFNVGVLGAKYLLDAVSEAGCPDAAFDLATVTGYPSWAHMLENGRTTLSEFWNLRGSHNHVMMGSVDAWFYRHLAGIQPDEEHPGFAHFSVRPHIPPSLKWVRAKTRTVRGEIVVSWSQSEAGLQLKVTVPPQSRATVYVPSPSKKDVSCQPEAKPRGFRSGRTVFRIGPGDYTFQAAR